MPVKGFVDNGLDVGLRTPLNDNLIMREANLLRFY
jgi:hypothetical protein